MHLLTSASWVSESRFLDLVGFLTVSESMKVNIGPIIGEVGEI